MPEELSRNCFDVILQHDWSVEQCLLHIRVFFGGKTKSPCFVLSIHWLIKQITNTYRNHFSRSYENRSILKICMNTAPLCTGLGIYCLYKILLIASMTSLVRQINTSGCKDVVRKTNVTINVYKIFACSSFSVHT